MFLLILLLDENLPEICQFATYQLLPGMTCVGAWVVTEWSVSCLGNSQVITKSCLKLVRLLSVIQFLKHCAKIWPKTVQANGEKQMSLTIVMREKRFCSEQRMLVTPTQVTAADGGKFTNFRQLLLMTCQLPRQESNHLVTTHTPTQVTTGSS